MNHRNRDDLWYKFALSQSIAFRAIRLTPVHFVLSAFALMVFTFMSSFLLATLNAREALLRQLTSSDHLTIYTSSEASQPKLEGLTTWVKSQPGVKRIEQKALNTYFAMISDSLRLERDSLGELPLSISPRVFSVYIESDKMSDAELSRLSSDLKARPEVLDVYFAGGTFIVLSELLRSFGRLVFFLLLICSVLALTRLYYGGRAALETSADAFSITWLVGARKMTQIMPFISYGILQWLAGIFLTFAVWGLVFPIEASHIRGVISELRGIFAPRISILDGVLIAISSAILSIGPVFISSLRKTSKADAFAWDSND
ncbi:MAG: hypothetical protein JW941_08715 [Candidatus Coatesbacteria bacterium]|nr:hypothetical protein [Candidatus Coatesbacteria bacterium]